MATGNGEPHFTIHVSRVVASELKKLQQKAWREGRGDEFLSAMYVLVEKLRHNPFRLGEPLYRLPALQLQVRHAAVGPLLIDFAVHEHERLLFIKGVKLLPQVNRRDPD
jgi:hypothetical protein